MAVSYMQLELLNPVGDVVVVDPYPNIHDTVVFDTIISSDGLGTNLDYDIGTGIITFLEAGHYYIDWFVAPQYGLTTDGSNWAIKTSGGLTIIGSSHSHVSATIGFALFNAAANETARLVNVSDGALHLSKYVKSKAGLVVHGVGIFSPVPVP